MLNFGHCTLLPSSYHIVIVIEIWLTWKQEPLGKMSCFPAKLAFPIEPRLVEKKYFIFATDIDRYQHVGREKGWKIVGNKEVLLGAKNLSSNQFDLMFLPASFRIMTKR